MVLDRSVLNFEGDLSKSKIKELRKASCAFTSGPFRESLYERFVALGIPEGMFSLEVKEASESDRDPQVLRLNYESVLEKGDYLKEAVLIEIGARSLREPSEEREICSIIGQALNSHDVAGKPFSVLTVTPPRTLLEKIFLLHEEFSKPGEKIRTDRMSRHLYDIERIMRTEHGELAFADADLYRSIVNHRQQFNAIRGLDYAGHHPERIDFIPPAEVIKEWEEDYKAMQKSMIYGDSLPFNELLKRLSEIQERLRSFKGF